MMLRSMTGIVFVTFAASCGTRAPAPQASSPPDAKTTAAPHQDETQEHEKLPTRVQLSPAVIASAGIKTAPVQSLALPDTVKLTGEIIADPDLAAKVALRVPGRIVDVRVKEGDRVRAGAVIAVVESPELARVRAEYAATAAKADAARQNANRLASVAEKGLAAGQEVASADAEARSLEAQARSARQTLAAYGAGAEGERARFVLRAPIGGYVLRRNAVSGQTVPADYVLVEIADLDRVYFLGRIFEKDLAKVKTGASAEIRLNAYPERVFTGKIEVIGREIDPAARTITARIVVDNHDDLLKVGLFGSALVAMPGPAPTLPRLVVPLSAVTKVADRDVVFVREPDGDFEMHQVTLGRTAEGKVEVLSGLRQGEAVTVSGVFTLKSAFLKSTFGEEE